MLRLVLGRQQRRAGWATDRARRDEIAEEEEQAARTGAMFIDWKALRVCGACFECGVSECFCSFAVWVLE